jgi:hypothetical protein
VKGGGERRPCRPAETSTATATVTVAAASTVTDRDVAVTGVPRLGPAHPAGLAGGHAHRDPGLSAAAAGRRVTTRTDPPGGRPGGPAPPGPLSLVSSVFMNIMMVTVTRNFGLNSQAHGPGAFQPGVHIRTRKPELPEAAGCRRRRRQPGPDSDQATATRTNPSGAVRVGVTGAGTVGGAWAPSRRRVMRRLVPQADSEDLT